MKQNLRFKLFPVVLCFVFGIACSDSTGPNSSEGLYPRPLQINDGWETASPEEVGMTSDSLLALIELISNTEDHLFHSVLIVKDNKLVFEEYWDGRDMPLDGSINLIDKHFDHQTLHYAASVSKSFTSALVGIALDQGLFNSVNETVFSFFPEYDNLKNVENENITLKDMLSFSSGFDWNEFEYGFDDPRDSHYQFFNTSDPMSYLLGRPVVTVPGTEFLYNSGDTNILGEIVKRSSSSNYLYEFAERYLLDPLGIETYHWNRMPQADSFTFASGGMYLRPRDMAKFGALYLNQGFWKGERIISSSWIESSTEISTPFAEDYRTLQGYGYQWWIGRFQLEPEDIRYYRATGWGGQYIIVFPDKDMVVVFTAGGYYENRPISFNDIIEYYIFEAIMK